MSYPVSMRVVTIKRPQPSVCVTTHKPHVSANGCEYSVHKLRGLGRLMYS